MQKVQWQGHFERVSYVTGVEKRKSESWTIEEELKLNEYPHKMIIRKRVKKKKNDCWKKNSVVECKASESVCESTIGYASEFYNICGLNLPGCYQEC